MTPLIYTLIGITVARRVYDPKFRSLGAEFVPKALGTLEDGAHTGEPLQLELTAVPILPLEP